MCGRYQLADEFSELRVGERWFQLPNPAASRDFFPSWRGGHEAPFLRRRTQNVDVLLGRFWFIPRSWHKPLNQLPASFNARAEGIAQKPFFRHSFARRRCLIPATEWHEYVGSSGSKSCLRLHLDGLFTFAGIWDDWLTSGGDVVTSFAIITTVANDAVAPYHDRMPLIVPERLRQAWLYDDASAPTLLQTLVATTPAPSVVQLDHAPSHAQGHATPPTRQGRLFPEC